MPTIVAGSFARNAQCEKTLDSRCSSYRNAFSDWKGTRGRYPMRSHVCREQAVLPWAGDLPMQTGIRQGEQIAFTKPPGNSREFPRRLERVRSARDSRIRKS